MKLETILDAMVATACGNMNWKQARRIRAKRQYHAFRARILRMTSKYERAESYLRGDGAWTNPHLAMICGKLDDGEDIELDDFEPVDVYIEELEQQLAAKDERIGDLQAKIAELEEELEE